MSKYHYVHFGDNVPKNVEKEYNRMARREQYLEEQDAAHDVMYLDHKNINRLPDRSVEDSEHIDVLTEKRLDYLPIALRLLKMDYPFEFRLISEYYFSEKNVTMLYLAKKYSISEKRIEYRMKKAKKLLKKYIIMHENEH